MESVGNSRQNLIRRYIHRRYRRQLPLGNNNVPPPHLSLSPPLDCRRRLINNLFSLFTLAASVTVVIVTAPDNCECPRVGSLSPSTTKTPLSDSGDKNNIFATCSDNNYLFSHSTLLFFYIIYLFIYCCLKKKKKKIVTVTCKIILINNIQN